MKLVLSILFLCSQILSSAQEGFEKLFYPPIELSDLPYELATQVHSLDDFIKRFNGLNNGIGQAFDQDSELYANIKKDQKKWSLFRRSILISLFNSEFFKAEFDDNKKYVDELLSLGEIDFYEKGIFAEVYFSANFNFQTVNGKVLLEYLGGESMGYSWKIRNAFFTESIELTALSEIKPINGKEFIPPNAHNNNFIYLHRIMNNHENLSPYISTSTQNISLLQQMIFTPDFHARFNDTQFILVLDEGRGFVLNNAYEIIRRTIPPYLN